MINSKVLSVLAGVMVIASSAVWASGAAVEGTINSIDKAAKRLNISHGPIKNLGMGAMTMDFSVADPSMLAAVKAGQKVKFSVEKDKQGNFVVTDLE